MATRQAIEAALRHMAPTIPPHEFEAVMDHATGPTLRRGSPEAAVWLSLTSYARHVFTDYDALLEEGYDRDSARHFVLDDINECLALWGVKRRILDGEDEGSN